jgi:hypothetical protein
MTSIIPKNQLNINDFNMYFSECFVLDPHTGLPGIIIQRYRDEDREDRADTLRVSLVEGKMPGKLKLRDVYYRNADIDPFFDMKLYYKGDLGYRSYNGGKELLYMDHQPLRIPSRGLSRRRVRINHDLMVLMTNNLVSTIERDRDLCWLVFNPESTELNKAVDKMFEGKSTFAIVDKDRALVLNGLPDCDRYPVLFKYRTAVIGKFDTDKTYHRSVNCASNLEVG